MLLLSRAAGRGRGAEGHCEDPENRPGRGWQQKPATAGTLTAMRLARLCCRVMDVVAALLYQAQLLLLPLCASCIAQRNHTPCKL